MNKEIIYDESFDDFTDENGMMILDLAEAIKTELLKGNSVQIVKIKSLDDGYAR